LWNHTRDDAEITLFLYPSYIRTKAIFSDTLRASAVATYLVGMGHLPFLVSETVESILALRSKEVSNDQ